MPIPDVQSILRPWLELVADGEEHALQDAIQSLGDRFGLSPDERSEMLPSGFQATFTNRVAWAATHLTKAGAIQRVGRGRYRITDRGREFLRSRTDVGQLLRGVREYQEFKGRGRQAIPAPSDEPLDQVSPAELLESAVQTVRSAVATELIERIKASPPAFFEQLVVDLLLRMGYGGSRRDAGAAVGRSGDGGIDGVIKEDRLGLDAVYIQAKRWENPVGRQVVAQFSGDLEAQRASKGVLITTSSFTADAHAYAKSISKRIVLVDGQQLAELMIDVELGVAIESTYRLVRVDPTFFEAG